ncbi:MAG: tryptophan synthase subunit alpha [Candidatus Omnitrophica bacterium]|nr:tryptophan synthase subunit alpha [Candidatus Omnitrophota bacterium]
MNRIEAKFKALKGAGRPALITYICAGDPDIKTTRRLLPALAEAGADIIEIGMPFSDPMADGPTIQMASQRALKNNVNCDMIFDMVMSVRSRQDTPLLLMGYYNPVYRYGIARFVANAKAAGIDGIIIPDLIPEESDELVLAARRHDFSTVFLASPTSGRERLKLISSKSTGFIYYVSLAGVTGARKSLPKDMRRHVMDIKNVSSKPVCVGFGVSTPRQAKRICAFSDGVIVGSAIIKIIENSLKHDSDIIPGVVSFVKKLRKAL